jgi:hypothetical protein
MIARSSFLLFVSLFALATSLRADAAREFDKGHGTYGQVLAAHVHDGLVDYASLNRNPAMLDQYLDQVAAVPEAEFRRWSEDDRLALLLNLYNAATLKLIVDHYPVNSIKDIGGFLRGPWKQKVVRLFGRVITLDHLEHEIIRKDYPDARAHFALVCAARGCPPLRAEAYSGTRLGEQMDANGKAFLGQSEKNRVDAANRTVHLSPIFKWFSEDFERHAGSVLNFVTPYFSEPDRQALERHEYRIRHTDYDWTLNDVAK